MTPMWWFSFLVAAIFFLYLPAAHIILKALRRVYCAGVSHYERVVCLTFDDGPDKVSTPSILEILRAQGVRATFFVLGRSAEKHPDVIAAIARDGHEIGEHGYSHLHPWKSMPWSYMCDLVAGHKSLNRLLGFNRQRRFRPTFGKANALTLMFVWLFHKTLTFWNVDPHDYKEQSDSGIVQSVLNQIHEARGAAIVLLHDGRTARWEKNVAATASAVDRICRELRREGYKFGTVGELTAACTANISKSLGRPL